MGENFLEILISTQSKTPIYEQIVTQLKKQILEGKLEVGTSIPGMRTLAKTLKVSVITVQKAYEILQAEGFITSKVGLGTYISLPEVSELKDKKRDELIFEMVRLINSFYSNGYDKNEMINLFIDECNKIEHGK